LSHAYSCDDKPVAGSAQSSNGEVIDSFSWRIAVSRPSRFAPMVMRCSCSSRCPLDVNICGRVIASRTGRRACCAAIAARVTCGHTIAFIPKLPPTKLVITRIFDSGTPSRCETVS
jgi:hypothetical protein